MKRTVVATAFPYPLIWDRGRLRVLVGNEAFDIDFQRQYRQTGDNIPSPSFSPGYSTSSNLEMAYDRWARVAYTRIDIWFPTYISKDNSKEIQKRMHAVINRVLEVYRFTTGEFHVDNIPMNELWEYEVMNTNEDGTFTSPIECRRVLPLGYSVTPARTVPIPDNAKAFMRDGTELPVPRLLLLNAKREKLLENYRLAVVEAETAFESLVDQTVAQHYRNQGFSEAEIENKLRAPLVNLISHHIPRCCGQQFEETPAHVSWRNDLYQLRNDIVHDGASANVNQAERALDAAEAAMKWVEMRTR